MLELTTIKVNDLGRVVVRALDYQFRDIGLNTLSNGSVLVFFPGGKLIEQVYGSKIYIRFDRLLSMGGCHLVVASRLL